jgi:putative glycerol-1-phosphate prenyltransferase
MSRAASHGGTLPGGAAGPGDTRDIAWPPPPPPWQSWRHVTKLDPDRQLPDRAIELVLASGTDALVLGGSSGVTRQKVLDLWDRLRSAGCRLPLVLELTDGDLAIPGFDLYWVPAVLNTPSGAWIFGHQARAMSQMLTTFGDYIPWSILLPAPYVVLNPAATAARITGATALTPSQAAGYGGLARLWRLPLLYLEYSGTYGDPELVRQVRRAAGPGTHLVYGGGIDSPGRAAEMAALADTVVVGNLVYHAPEQLAATVAATRQAPPPP